MRRSSSLAFLPGNMGLPVFISSQRKQLRAKTTITPNKIRTTKNAANRPNVDRRGIVGVTHQDLRRTIPKHEIKEKGDVDATQRKRYQSVTTSCEKLRTGTLKARARPKSANFRVPS